MAKKELEEIPVFGIWFRTIDIAVDRKNARKAAEAYKKATRFFESGRSLVIFPEGTISNQVPKMIKFKDGPFRMAIEKQIDLFIFLSLSLSRVEGEGSLSLRRRGKSLSLIYSKTERGPGA